MARVHPPAPDPDLPRSEEKVLAALGRLPGRYVVLHGRRFMLPGDGSNTPREGEADFIVLDPERGYLVIEVKGGGIERDGAEWFSTDRHGRRHRIKDPGRQAQGAAHAIAACVRRHPRFAAGDRPRFGWGVALPDVGISGPLGPELPREMVIGRDDLDEVESALRRMFGAQGISGPAMARDRQHAFVESLAPTLRLVPSLSERIEEDEPALLRLTDEQMQILDVMAEVRRIAVKGGAGTGKTVIAMERARRLAADGKRTLFLCFNRPLAEKLAGVADGFVVSTFHGFCRDQAKKAGIPFEVPSGAAEQSEFWESRAPDLLMEALDVYPDERWDAVIVDEGQDFREYWWLGVEKLLKDQGKDVLWVFFDPNQDLWGGGPTDALDLQAAALSWNCRNTGHIAKYSAGLIGQEANVRPGAPEGLAVDETSCTDDREMTEAVRKALHTLIGEEKIDPTKVMVLSPRGTSGSIVWRARRFGNLRLVEYPKAPGANEVSFSSVQRFKGLEADAIVLCEVREGYALCSPRHLYVGTSRARHVLVVLRYARG